MSKKQMRELSPGYSAETNTVNETKWGQLLEEFDDANIYQTWAYAEVICGRGNMSHLILKKDGEVTALAQARIARLPFLNAGIAYVHWGPIWRRTATAAKIDIFREAVRALRNEFVCKRGLVLRLFPMVFDDGSGNFTEILAEEGFSPSSRHARGRTILMDLVPPLEDLREGMRQHWKRSLKAAERNGLELVEGSQDQLFKEFIDIYQEMVARKKFVEPNDINQFRTIQGRLPDKLKMNILLCRSAEGRCAGLVGSGIGNTTLYLFGATSNTDMKSKGSYLLHWKLIEHAKRNGMSTYNLNGINPDKNPGTFRFKGDLAGKNGRDVCYLGRFDSLGSSLSSLCVECGDTVQMIYRTLKARFKTPRAVKAIPSAANTVSMS